MLSERRIAITNIARRNGLTLTEGQQARLEQYGELLLEWNKKINLISRRDEENVWDAHILHALSILFLVRLPNQGKVLDLGTGGGLPGIPLAIVRPDLQFILVDSIAKKVRAVEDMVRRIGLENVLPVCSRVEELGRQDRFSHSFDVVIARAVAPLVDLLRWSRPLLRMSSTPGVIAQELRHRKLPHDISSPYLLCMKGGDVEAEVREARLKAGAAEIAVLDIVFRDGPIPTLEEKKLIVAR